MLGLVSKIVAAASLAAAALVAGPATAHAATAAPGVVLYESGLLVNGTYVPIGPSPYLAADAGVGGGSVGPITGGQEVCGPLGLVCVPGSAGIYYNGGPFAAISVSVLGTTYVTVPGGSQCVLLYSVGPGVCPRLL